MPSAGWGVRPTSASSIPASFVAGCLDQVERTYEEVVVCRGSHRIVKGSVARHQKQPNQRQQDEGLSGRGSKGLGLLAGSSEGLWVCNGRSEGGDDDVGDRNQLDLAINPSPWGAFIGGPPGENTTLGRNRKRPSSAPRPPSTTTNLAPGLEVGSGRVQARPRSAHAASPSRNCATEVFVTTGYSICDEEDGSGPKAVGAEIAIQKSASRSSRSGWPVRATDTVELGGETDAGQPRQADRARLSKSSCQQMAAGPDADLAVVARQAKIRTMSPSKKAEAKVCDAAFCCVQCNEHPQRNM